MSNIIITLMQHQQQQPSTRSRTLLFLSYRDSTARSSKSRTNPFLPRLDDDGTGDELELPLGTTAFVSGHTMFEILPPEYKSLAVRTKVKYAPHPYVWMAPAHAMSTGLGIETEGLELPLNELPPWEEEKIKVYPVVSLPIRRCNSQVADVIPPAALEEPRHR